MKDKGGNYIAKEEGKKGKENVEITENGRGMGEILKNEELEEKKKRCRYKTMKIKERK